MKLRAPINYCLRKCQKKAVLCGTAAVNLFFLLLFMSCKTPDLLLSPELKRDTVSYEVRGRQGLMINQVLSFGPFKTSRVKRGWTQSYDIPFVLRFQGSKERFSFTQFNADSLKAGVFCLGKLKSTELELVNDHFGIPIEYENTFTGSIVFAKTNFWDFVINNPDAGYGSGEYATGGFVRSNSGQIIEIKPVNRLENHKGLKNIDNYGFEFYIESSPVAAVSTMNRGKVWLRSGLSKEQMLVLSALCSAILIKSNLGELTLE